MALNQQTIEFISSKLTTPQALVKAKIIALGLTLSQVAEAARLTNAQVTRCLNFTNQSRPLRVRLVTAIRQLTGCRSISLEYFWPSEMKGAA